MSGPVIHFPTEEENERHLEQFFKRMKSVNRERTEAAVVAMPALKRLCKVMCNRSGQCYKVRTLLYSMWNGKPAQLNELLGLDWEIRKDMCAVMLAFGFESESVKFFYKAIEGEIRAVNQWHWFLEERLNYKVLEEYAEACKSEADQ